jgi:hypothetical protein
MKVFVKISVPSQKVSEADVLLRTLDIDYVRSAELGQGLMIDAFVKGENMEMVKGLLIGEGLHLEAF